jgi:hypothetical protein
MSGLLVLYLVLSFALVGIVAVLARDQGRNLGIVSCIAALATLGSFCLLFSLGLVVQSLLTLAICAVSGIAGASRKISISGSVLAAVAGLVLTLRMDAEQWSEDEQLRARYPLVSLDDRLAYEKKHAGKLNASPVLSTEVEGDLAQREEFSHDSMRRSLLQQLHERSREQFVGITGLGAIRMRGMMHGGYLDLPEEPSVPLPKHDARPYDPGDDSPGELLAASTPAPTPESQALVEMHRAGTGDFLDPERMGYVDKSGRVAGFSSHLLSSIPSINHQEPTQAWETTRLELVGLLVYDEPVVYVTEHLPRLEELQKAATRELDDFERQALDELQTEKDLVTDIGSNKIRMLGALRAGNDCLECHNVPRGQLLGAFSYELQPARRTPEAPEKVAAH